MGVCTKFQSSATKKRRMNLGKEKNNGELKMTYTPFTLANFSWCETSFASVERSHYKK